MLETKHFYEFGPFRLDPTERLLLRNNQPVPLAPKAFETLVLLVENSGRLLTKDELMKRLSPGTFVVDPLVGFFQILPSLSGCIETDPGRT